MIRRPLLLAAFLIAVLATPALHLSARAGHGPATPTAQPASTASAALASVDPGYLKLLRWRMVGPSRGGRVVAVAGDPVDKLTFYQGSTGGGVWKTDDGGLNWRNISDGFFNTGSVGAIAVAPSNTNIVYVGMGEACIRGNASYGDGVYKSLDGGKTWSHLGLEATRQIARVRVNPTNPDLVYVAALGDPWGSSPDRGVYRSKDGGRTWEKVLFRSNDAGAIDLVMDPTNPDVLYASTLELRRYPWGFRSAGPGTALYKSTDGGTTWTELTAKPGLPSGTKGRIGIAVAPTRPNRVWAIVDAELGKKGVYRSEDGGETWKHLTDDADLTQRPWYYHHIFADPKDPDTLWVLNVDLWRSKDGGEHFEEVAIPHGDNHDLWIDPADPQRMIEGNDGGAVISFNGGKSWSTNLNQPTAQFYHVSADNQFPYRHLRRAAGQHDDVGAEPVRPRPDHDRGVGDGRRRRGRLRRPEPRGFERRLRRGSPLPEQVRSADAPGARHLAQPRNALRLGRSRHQLPLLVDVPGDDLAERSEDALRDVAVRAPHDERRPELGHHQPRPDAPRSEDARAHAVVHPPGGGRVLGADHARGVRAGVVRDDLRVRRVAGEGGCPLGGLRRRLGARVAGQRQDVAEGDAARPAGVRAHQHHRSVAARSGRRVSGGHALQAAGRPSVSVQDRRLREDVDEDHDRHPRHRLHARRPRGPGPPRPALRGHRDRRLRLVRRRRTLAVDAAEPAGRARARSDREGRRSRRRDARPLVLDSRRRRAAAAVRPDDGHRAGASSSNRGRRFGSTRARRSPAASAARARTTGRTRRAAS